MTLATILAVYCLSVGWLTLGGPEFAVVGAAQQTQNPPAQASEPPSPATGQTQNSTGQAKPSAKHHPRRKKAAVPDCSKSSTAQQPAAGAAGDATGGHTTSVGSANPARANAGSGNPDAASSTPCPPPKKVVRNGGSDEPTVQLTGGATAEQASVQRSTTEQLNAASQENLKKIAERQLTPTQQETVTQIQQFMEQSKKAVAAGDLERGHNLALKANLLSDELVKP
jgi:hypothetical protein